jgi:hypothetical protein
MTSVSYLVCDCQVELNNCFNLVKKPCSCLLSPTSSCLSCPASDCLPLLPPPGQKHVLHETRFYSFYALSAFMSRAGPSTNCKPNEGEQVSVQSVCRNLAQKQCVCATTCSGACDTIDCPLHFSLILCVAHEQSFLSVCQDPAHTQ